MKYLIHSIYHQRGDAAVWWAPNSGGYTTSLDLAGRYTREEALRIVDREGRNEAFLECDAVALARMVLDTGRLSKLIALEKP